MPPKQKLELTRIGKDQQAQLKPHFLLDLNTGKFKYIYVGQINTYLEYYKNEMMQEGDNSPVVILLCNVKGSTFVKYPLAELEKSVIVHKYMVEYQVNKK